MKKRALMVGVGELLWDLLPSGKVLGGAPSNFAYMCRVLGNEGIVASRVGDDVMGRAARDALLVRGLDASHIQLDAEHKTGTAQVVIDSDGQPRFTIADSVAWDYLQWTPEWEKISRVTDVVCFGTLAQRSQTAAQTIMQFLQQIPAEALRICDVNLRSPFYSLEALDRSLRCAQIAKLNEQELHKVAAMFQLKGSGEESLARSLLTGFELQLVCITRGARGSLLVSKTESVEHDGIKVKVADAIGAGDAFTACVAHSYIRGRSLDEISEMANRFASWVATQSGATPVVSEDKLHDIFGRDHY